MSQIGQATQKIFLKPFGGVFPDGTQLYEVIQTDTLTWSATVNYAAGVLEGERQRQPQPRH